MGSDVVALDRAGLHKPLLDISIAGYLEDLLGDASKADWCLQKGRLVLAQGKVASVQGCSDGSVTARCAGSDERSCYSVRLPSPPGVLSCSCPAWKQSTACKHVVACLLWLQQEQPTPSRPLDATEAVSPLPATAVPQPPVAPNALPLAPYKRVLPSFLRNKPPPAAPPDAPKPRSKPARTPKQQATQDSLPAASSKPAIRKRRPAASKQPQGHRKQAGAGPFRKKQAANNVTVATTSTPRVGLVARVLSLSDSDLVAQCYAVLEAAGESRPDPAPLSEAHSQLPPGQAESPLPARRRLPKSTTFTLAARDAPAQSGGCSGSTQPGSDQQSAAATAVYGPVSCHGLTPEDVLRPPAAPMFLWSTQGGVGQVGGVGLRREGGLLAAGPAAGPAEAGWTEGGAAHTKLARPAPAPAVLPASSGQAGDGGRRPVSRGVLGRMMQGLLDSDDEGG